MTDNDIDEIVDWQLRKWPYRAFGSSPSIHIRPMIEIINDVPYLERESARDAVENYTFP